jgi:hypothetical protein
MRKLFALALCAALFVGIGLAQDVPAPAKAGPHAVEGLVLPEASEISYTEGFVDLQAQTKGTVKWLVLSTSTKVKFRVRESLPNEITIAVPPFEAAITVFAIAVVDGKQTEFARTDLVIKGPTNPLPPPGPGPPDPKPGPLTPPFYLSIVEDPATRTPGINSIVGDAELRESLKTKQVKMRVFSAGNAADLKRFNFDEAVKAKGVPLMILQDKTGKGVAVERLPADKAAFLKRLGELLGGS